MNATTTAPKAAYDAVMAAIAEGAAVTAGQLETATEYAKRAKRRRPQGATIAAEATPEMTPHSDKNHKNKGAQCSADGCDREASARGLCARDYTRAYRADKANRERANEASRRYHAKKASQGA